MITPLLIYSAVTILLAGVDWYRRKKMMGKVLNIDHKVSTLLGALGLVATCLPFVIGIGFWKALLTGIGCIGVRLLIYDPALALMNRTNPFKNSLTSDSKTEQFENKHHITFWQQRGLACVLIAISLYVNYLLK